jgi:hypothetical protein
VDNPWLGAARAADAAGTWRFFVILCHLAAPAAVADALGSWLPPPPAALPQLTAPLGLTATLKYGFASPDGGAWVIAGSAPGVVSDVAASGAWTGYLFGLVQVRARACCFRSKRRLYMALRPANQRGARKHMRRTSIRRTGPLTRCRWPTPTRTASTLPRAPSRR